MSTYNTLYTHLECPRCRNGVDVEIECFFGDTSDMRNLRIGDVYPWRPLKAVQNGGRPQNGDLDGRGYAVCPKCERDFHLRVLVRSDVAEEAVVDFSRVPYISD